MPGSIEAVRLAPLAPILAAQDATVRREEATEEFLPKVCNWGKFPGTQLRDGLSLLQQIEFLKFLGFWSLRRLAV